MTIYLYIKQHSVTGLKYFGKTTSKNPFKYRGSGKYWISHIRKYGKQKILTLEVWGFDDQNLCTEFALKFSEDNDIVKSDEWANLMPENAKYGLVITDELRKILSSAQKNSNKHSTRGKSREKFADSIRGQNNPFYGKSHSNKTKKRLSEVAKNRPEEVRKRIRKTLSSKRWYTNGIDSLFIDPTNGIPDGYFSGRIYKRKL